MLPPEGLFPKGGFPEGLFPEMLPPVVPIQAVLSGEAFSRAEVPLITMSMGPLGVISRVCGQSFGSAATFGAAHRASAPGQMDVFALDAVLLTHIDNDHFSRPTCHDVSSVCPAYHAPCYVAEVACEEGLPGVGHSIGETFAVGNATCRLTPAWHNWQNDSKKWGYRTWEREDYCGYWINTPDGSIWLPGDSKLLPEHLEMPEPDLILLDFSDNEWHITFDGAVRLANTYPNARLLCIHWGTVDAPDWSTFNGDPRVLAAHVTNPERVLAPVPGEAVVL